MKSQHSNIRNLLTITFLFFVAFSRTFACQTGIAGKSNPGSTVCAKDSSGNVWCTITDAQGNFNLIGGGPSPSTRFDCLPTSGVYSVYNNFCPDKGQTVDRGTSQWAGGPWLDVSCTGCISLAPNDMSAWYPFDSNGPSVTGELLWTNVPNGGGSISPYSSWIDGKLYGGPSSTSGMVYKALSFDGVDDYVQAPHHQAFDFGKNNFSLVAWVKIHNPSDVSNVRVLAEKRSNTPKLRGFSFFLYNGKLAAQLADGGDTIPAAQYANYVSTNLLVPADGKWHLVGVTIDRNNSAGGVFYLDDKPPTTFNPTGIKGDLNTTSALRLGSVTIGNPGSLFKGDLDEMIFVKRALGAQEFQALFTAGVNGACKPGPIAQ